MSVKIVTGNNNFRRPVLFMAGRKRCLAGWPGPVSRLLQEGVVLGRCLGLAAWTGRSLPEGHQCWNEISRSGWISPAHWLGPASSARWRALRRAANGNINSPLLFCGQSVGVSADWLGPVPHYSCATGILWRGAGPLYARRSVRRTPFRAWSCSACGKLLRLVRESNV